MGIDNKAKEQDSRNRIFTLIQSFPRNTFSSILHVNLLFHYKKNALNSWKDRKITGINSILLKNMLNEITDNDSKWGWIKAYFPIEVAIFVHETI